MSYSPSALISDNGQRMQLRVDGRIYEVPQEDLRSLLGLPTGPPGLGISIDQNRFQFEFEGEDRTIEITERQLKRCLAKLLSKNR